LPPALIQADPRVQDLTATLEERLAGKDQALTDGAQLATLLCGDTQLNKKDAVSFAQLLSACGFGIEPDVRMGGPILGPGPAVLFREDADAAPSASPAYSSASTLLTLAVAVASADGVTSSAEAAHLVAQLEGNLQLTRSEQRRLRAHLEYLTATGVKLTGLQRRMTDLTGSERETIGDFVTAVAAADGVIDPAEVTILTKIYKLLGLDPETVFQKLHVAAAPVAPRPASEPVTVRPAGPEDGYAIPARRRGRHATASESPGLLLNPDLIESKLAETHAVAALLTTIFVDDETPPSLKPSDSRLDGAAATTAAGGTQLLTKAPTVTVEGLDANHSAFLLALQAVTTVSRSHFDELAAEHSLMPEGAIDVLNEASYEASGEPVLDGDDPMEVNSVAMKELFS
jgi:tellurite resistance protein